MLCVSRAPLSTSALWCQQAKDAIKPPGSTSSLFYKEMVAHPAQTGDVEIGRAWAEVLLAELGPEKVCFFFFGRWMSDFIGRGKAVGCLLFPEAHPKSRGHDFTCLMSGRCDLVMACCAGAQLLSDARPSPGGRS